MIEINWNPSNKELRWFGVGVWVLTAVLIVMIRLGRPWPDSIAIALAAMGGVALVLAIFRPQWLRWIYLVWMIAVFPIGWVVSHVVLAMVFFGFITPIGWLLRLRGYDPLQRKKQGGSLWTKRPADKSPESYFRQY